MAFLKPPTARWIACWACLVAAAACQTDLLPAGEFASSKADTAPDGGPDTASPDAQLDASSPVDGAAGADALSKDTVVSDATHPDAVALDAAPDAGASDALDDATTPADVAGPDVADAAVEDGTQADALLDDATDAAAPDAGDAQAADAPEDVTLTFDAGPVCSADLDCAAFDDGDKCNGAWICDKSSGVAKCALNPASVVTCASDNDTVCAKASCDPASGTCALLPVAGTVVCDDADACTKGDFCQAGLCKGAALEVSKDCDDGNLCTDDSCQAAKGCVHQANAGPCVDGNACTDGDSCKAGSCVAGAAKNCDDGEACTVDGCDPTTGCGATGLPDLSTCPGGLCVGGKCGPPCPAMLEGKSCDDGDPCTIGEACAQGKCSWQGPSRVETVAGGSVLGWFDGPSTFAKIGSVAGMARAANGDVWFSDGMNHRIRKWTTKGEVVSVCGSGQPGFADGGDDKVVVSNPTGLGFDSGGALYFNDFGNHRIRRRSVFGLVATFSGSGVEGDADGAPGTASFRGLRGMLVVKDGMFVTDAHRVRHVSWGGVVTTFAGSAKSGKNDGVGSGASFYQPQGLTMDADGNLLVADSGNHLVRRINSNGVVQTLVGTGAPGNGEGPPTLATLHDPFALLALADGRVVILEHKGGRARMLLPGKAPLLVNLIQNSSLQYIDGPLSKATLSWPASVLADGKDVLVGGNGSIRRIVLSAPVCSDGNPCTADACDSKTGDCTHQPMANGVTCGADASCAEGVCTQDCAKKGDGAICSDDNLCTFGEVCKAGKCEPPAADAVTALAGAGGAGYLDGEPAAAKFSNPWGMALDEAGGLVFADRENNRIRRWVPGGKVTTLAGTGAPGQSDGPAAQASFDHPQGVAIDVLGHIWVADSGNRRIRRIAPDGQVTTVAGSKQGHLDGKGALAAFSSAAGIAIGPGGVAWVADGGAVRKVTADGVVSTLCGGSQTGFLDGQAQVARFNGVRGVTVDLDGYAYVSDAGNHAVRWISPDGDTATVAGLGAAGLVDGPLGLSRLSSPDGLALDKEGTLFIADSGNHAVRAMLNNGVVRTVAGNGQAGSSTGPALKAELGDVHAVVYRGRGRFALTLGAGHVLQELALGQHICDDGLACTKQLCEPKTGACVATPLPDNTPCRDGGVCDLGTCLAGPNWASAVAAGANHSCALRQDGRVWCWGVNEHGQLGSGGTVDAHWPVEVAGIKDATAVVAGDGFSCALVSGGAVKCWGRNDLAQLGIGAKSGAKSLPQSVVKLTGAVDLAAGQGHVLARTGITLNVTSWGDNAGYKAAPELDAWMLQPYTWSGYQNIFAVAAGKDHACFAYNSGTTWCFGSNLDGQLGAGPISAANKPVLAQGVAAVSLAAGQAHTCAADKQGVVWCWGRNHWGEIGTGVVGCQAPGGAKDCKSTGSAVPKAVDKLKGTSIQAVSASGGSVGQGGEHTCARSDGGQLWCWGRNGSGQLGNGSKNHAAEPVAVQGLTGVASVSAGGIHTCASRVDGTVYCWGDGGRGRIAAGATLSTNTPSRIHLD